MYEKQENEVKKKILEGQDVVFEKKMPPVTDM